jgi:hypothetical protein
MAAVTRQQDWQVFFKDGHGAGLQFGDPSEVIVNANNGMADFRKTDGGDETDIARAYDSNVDRGIGLELRIHRSPFHTSKRMMAADHSICQWMASMTETSMLPLFFRISAHWRAYNGPDGAPTDEISPAMEKLISFGVAG